MTDHDVLADLEARGLVQECIDRDGLAARMAEGPITLYFGCDPTADSLHVGNLLGLLVLRRFHDAGHVPIALAGGATGMIGDPSGRSQERNLLDEATLSANVAAIKAQIARVVGDDVMLVDNRDWTGDIGLLDFLRDVGKHVTVNTMLGRESVKNRLASEHGISYTEFSYMLLQANDFLLLEQRHGCQLQIGGSDQWGNMLGGVDLIRRVNGRPAWALGWPLLTAPDGTKLGKTTGARIWLDPDKTSPYQFFQHWMQTDDRQVHQFLAQFTLLPMAEIEAVVTAHLAEPGRREGQRRLAREATSLVHGPAQAAAAEEASAILFGAPVADASIEALDAVAREVPVLDATADDLAAGLDLVDLLARPGSLAASKGEARRAVDQGGVYVNGARADGNRQVNAEDTLHGRYVVLRRGKKSVALLRIAVSTSPSST
ncbi:MAG: tyrosine--tRNA ligase [Acidimicrobiales bacterium]|nr:tyrosine--tRNA ligase [Acidimicrobiales bacterium]